MSATGNVAYLRIEADVKNARTAVQQLDKDFTVLDSVARKAGSGVAEFGKQTAQAETDLRKMTGKSRQDWAKFQRELTASTVSGAQARELAIKREFASKRKELREYLNDGRVSQERYDKWLTALNDAQARKLNKQHTEELKSVSTLNKGYAKLTAALKALGVAYVGYKALATGVRIGNASYQSFKEFESATTDMSKITSRELGKIKAEITELPAVLGNSTALMRGYYQSISAQAADPLDALVTASKSAKAAHVEQAETIKALTKLMAGFSGEIKTATDASDLLFAIEKQGQTSFGELVPIIGEVASVSKQAGVNQYEMGAALAAMTQTAGSTSQAATQYKAVIMGLFKPQEEMRKALSALGFESGQAAVQALGFAGALQALDSYATKSGVGLGKLFESSEALTGIGPMLATSFSKYNTNLEEMQKSAGGTDKAFQEWQKTSEATGEVLDNTLGKFAVKFGQELAPAINREMGALTTWLNDNQDGIYTGFEKIADGVGLLGDAARGTWSAYEYLTLKIAGGIAIARGEVPTNQVVTFMQADIAEMEQMLTYFGKLKHTLAADAANMQNVVMIGSVIEPGSLEREYFKELEGIKDAWMLSNNYIGQHSKSTVDEIVEHAVSGGALISKEEMKEIEKRIKAGKKEADAYSAGVVARSVVTKEQEAAITKALEEHREQRRKKAEDLHKKMFAGIEQLDAGYWSKRRSDLDTQYEYLKKHVEDQKALEVWYHQELYQLDREEHEEKLKSAQSTFERQAYYAGNYFDFMRAKVGEELVVWADAKTRQQKLYEETWAAMKDVGQSAMRSLSDTTGDVLFDGIRGQMEDLGDYWNSFWDSMLKTMTRSIGEMVIAWGTSKLIDFGANFIGGFLSSYHTGAIRLTQDEIVAKLLKNETVIPPKQSMAIDAAMGGGGLSKSEYFDKMTGYVQAGAALDFSYDTQDPDVAGMGVSNALSSLTAGIAAGVSNFTSIMGQAEKLKDTGLNIDMGKARGFAFDYAMAGVASGVVGGFLGNMIGDVGSYYLGVSEYAPYAKILNTAIASVLGLPGPVGLLAAALSPVTALAFAAVADAFDIRDQETFKDAMESKYGWSKGLRMTQAMQEYAAKTLGAEFAGMGWADDISGLNLDVPSVELQGGVVQPGETVVMTPIAAKDLLDPAKVQQTFNALSDGLNEYRSREARDRYGEYGGKLSGGWNDSGGHHDGSEGHNVGGEKGSSTGTGGGYNDGHGGVSGLAKGGPITSLWVPNGEDGLKPVKFAEGIVSRDGMELLARINSGVLPSSNFDASTVLSSAGNITDALEYATSSLTGLLQDEIDLLTQQLNEAKKQSENWTKYATTLNSTRLGYVTDSSLSIVSPDRQAAFIERQWNDAALRAKLGDEDAIAELQGLSKQFLSSSLEQAKLGGDFDEYRQDFSLVQRTLADVEALSMRHASTADEQAATLQEQLDAYQASLDAVNGVDTTLKSVRSDTSAINSAVTQYLQAKSNNAASQLALYNGARNVILDYHAHPENYNYDFRVAQAARDKYADPITDVQYLQALGREFLVGKTTNWANEMRQRVRDLGEVPQFATGGWHQGGLRIVGEHGAELEYTPPAQYFSAGQTAAVAGVWDRMLENLIGSRNELADLRLGLEAMGSRMIILLEQIRDVAEKWDHTGMPKERAA